MDNLNILLLGAGNRVSLCEWFIEAGRTYNKKINIFSVEIKNPVPISTYANILKGEKWDSPKFEQSIIDICNTYNINIIIPLMDAGCTALSKYKDSIELQTKAWVVVSSQEICKIMEDKYLAQEWFLNNKVEIPYDYGYNTTFPRIYKSITGFGSRDQFIVKDDTELSYIKKYKNLDNYMDQPFIEGIEYTVDAYISKEGKLIGAVSRVRLETINGEVSRGITKKEPELLEEVTRILSLPGFLGPITIQAIRSELDNKWYFLEINPRAGGGLIQSLKAGANYTECLIAEYLQQKLPDCSKWEENLLMTRCNREIWHRNGKVI